MSLLQKARFLTNLTSASREKETGLLTVLTFFQWSHGYIDLQKIILGLVRSNDFSRPALDC